MFCTNALHFTACSLTKYVVSHLYKEGDPTSHRNIVNGLMTQGLGAFVSWVILIFPFDAVRNSETDHLRWKQHNFGPLFRLLLLCVIGEFDCWPQKIAFVSRAFWTDQCKRKPDKINSNTKDWCKKSCNSLVTLQSPVSKHHTGLPHDSLVISRCTRTPVTAWC